MSTRTHVFLIIVAIIASLLVLRLVATRQLRSKYALLWLVVAAAMIVTAAFPGLLDEVADITGVDYAPALFLLIAVGILGLLVGHLTWEVSRLEMRLRTLAEDNALLRTALRERLRLDEPSGDADPDPGRR